MENKLRLTLFVSLFVVSISMANAGNYDPPPYCVDGRAHNDLKAEGPKYVGTNITRSFKGDYHFDLSFETRWVNFYNSYDNFVGDEKTNFEMNAYKEMTFPNSARGPQWVWVKEETFDSLTSGCSKMGIFVQNLPTATANSLSGGSSIRGQIGASIDVSYSKNAVEGDGKPKITYTFVNTWYSKVERITSSSNSFMYAPRYNGIYEVSASVSDGSYSKTVNLGSTHFSGGTDCNTCGEIP